MADKDKDRVKTKTDANTMTMLSRSMWQTKRAEELELAARDMEEVLPNIPIMIISYCPYHHYQLLARLILHPKLLYTSPYPETNQSNPNHL